MRRTSSRRLSEERWTSRRPPSRRKPTSLGLPLAGKQTFPTSPLTRKHSFVPPGLREVRSLPGLILREARSSLALSLTRGHLFRVHVSGAEENFRELFSGKTRTYLTPTLPRKHISVRPFCREMHTSLAVHSTASQTSRTLYSKVRQAFKHPPSRTPHIFTERNSEVRVPASPAPPSVTRRTSASPPSNKRTCTVPPSANR